MSPPASRPYPLACSVLQEAGTLDSLIRLNRPAVVKLRDAEGRKFSVALTAIKGDKATIEMGSEVQTVDLREIENKWADDYTVLWNIPPGYQDKIRPGSKGVVAAWIDLQLSSIQGREPRQQKQPVYDADLVAQVKKFQSAEGLLADGIVGPQTIIHLSTAAGGKVPKLLQ